jgi:ADP-ribosylglycohydrolase
MTHRGLELVTDTAETPEDKVFPHTAGSLIGSAAADALGWITEFVRGVDHLRRLYRTDRVTEYRSWQKQTGGRFNSHIDFINKGDYSDDTQLTLAVARSLNADGSVDITHFSKVELPLWLDYARGAGSSITAGAKSIRRKSARWNDNFYRYKHRGSDRDYREAGGNGSAMRVGPIALANYARPDLISDGVWRTSIVTHGHPTAIVGALLYAHALGLCVEGSTNLSRSALLEELTNRISSEAPPLGSEFESWMSRWNTGFEFPFVQVLDDVKADVIGRLRQLAKLPEGADPVSTFMTELGCFSPERKGSGTATVLAAIAIFLQGGRDPRKAVLRAINYLGADTDTIGSFVGGLCGALHGYESIPHEWASELQDYDYFMRVATELTRIAVGTGLGGKALLPQPTGELGRLPKLLELMRADGISFKERVYHPIFGAGWVESVDVQQLKRRDGGQVIFVRVNFDLGQSCKFKEIRLPRRRRS